MTKKRVQIALHDRYSHLFAKYLQDYLSRGYTVVPGTMHCNAVSRDGEGSFIVVLEKFE